MDGPDRSYRPRVRHYVLRFKEKLSKLYKITHNAKMYCRKCKMYGLKKEGTGKEGG